MSYNRVDRSLFVTQDKPLDAKLGPWASTAEAIAGIGINRRYQGLIIEVIENGSAVEYWWRDGVQDIDLIAKVSGSGGGDMFKATYDIDNDGVVDSAETVKIIVRNSTGSTLTKGQIVYLSGATGNRPNAILSDATDEITSSKTIGMVAANISNNSDGYVAVSGTLHDLDTTSFTAGDSLWLSETPGAMQANTPPTEPAHSVFIGYVARSHPTQGRVVLAIQNGYELTELHGVTITTPATNDFLYYASDGLWKNKQLSKSDVGLGNVPNTDATNPANITQSSSYRFVTDTEKSTWNGKQDSLGFTPENVANKSTSVTTDQASDTKYPTVKSVYDWAVGAFTTTSAVATQITTALTGYATQAWVNSQGFITNVISALGFTPENVANKQTDLTASATNYPTVNAVNTGLATKENTITAGTTAQYYRGDKTFQTLDKTAVGLGNVDNTADASKTFAASQITSGTFANARIPQVSRPNIRITTAVSSGNSTNEQVITSISIPANSLAVGDIIRLGAMFSFASNTTTKTPRIRFGLNTTTGTILYGPSTLAASISANTVELIGIVTSTTNLRLGPTSTVSGLGTGTGATINFTIDITTSTSFSFNVQKGAGTDTAILEFAWVEILTS